MQSRFVPPKYFRLSLFFGVALQPLYELLDGPANHIRPIFERQLSICCQAVNFLQGGFVNSYRNSFHIRKTIWRTIMLSTINYSLRIKRDEDDDVVKVVARGGRPDQCVSHEANCFLISS